MKARVTITPRVRSFFSRSAAGLAADAIGTLYPDAHVTWNEQGGAVVLFTVPEDLVKVLALKSAERLRERLMQIASRFVLDSGLAVGVEIEP